MAATVCTATVCIAKSGAIILPTLTAIVAYVRSANAAPHALATPAPNPSVTENRIISTTIGPTAMARVTPKTKARKKITAEWSEI
jgi:hypothetical protein